MHRDADHLATALEKVVNVLETTGTEHRRVIPAGRKLLGGERQIDCLAVSYTHLTLPTILRV